MAQQGYLIITDITGYTGFLTQAELEHAQGILADLFKALLGSMKPPFVIAKLEGDAIFAYSPPGGFIQAQTLIEAIEGVYFAFKRQQEIIQLNTTCTCTACRLIPTLDLKFAVHHGSYLVQQLGPSRELTGADVILIHRLLKNTVVETTGVKAYAFFTAAAAEAIDLGELCDEMIPHTERYEHIGEVHGYVYDLRPSLAYRKEQNRVEVTPDRAWIVITDEYPIPAPLLWDYLIEPSRRAAFLGVNGVSVTDRQNGRIGVGTIQHCEHGEGVSPHRVVDWRPFEYVTHEDTTLPFGGVMRFTSRLTPFEGGTRLTAAFGVPFGKNALHNLAMKVYAAVTRGGFKAALEHNAATLKEIVLADLTAGRIPSLAQMETESAAYLAAAAG